MSFDELYDRMTAAGISVGVASDRGGLAITLADGRGRLIRYGAPRGLDRAAAEIVLSGRLRQMLGPRDGRQCVGSWPEFVALWP